jgi:hypothetical protein
MILKIIWKYKAFKMSNMKTSTCFPLTRKLFRISLRPPVYSSYSTTSRSWGWEQGTAQFKKAKTYVKSKNLRWV